MLWAGKARTDKLGPVLRVALFAVKRLTLGVAVDFVCAASND